MKTYDKASPVKLRGRKMPSGNTSLYLDIYTDGRREYEYLKLYLLPEKTRADKIKNRQTLEFAEAVRAKRATELRNEEHGFANRVKKASFLAYYESEAVKRYGPDRRAWSNWWSAYKLIRAYDPRPDIKFSDITPRWLNGFKSYMDTTGSDHPRTRTRGLTESARYTYLSRITTVLNSAVRAGIIPRSPMANIDNYRPAESKREYLTQDEVRVLSATPCGRDVVRRAFLFSCLTGLRYSDIAALTWAQVHQQGEFARLVFRQKKTQGQEYLDISPLATPLMGDMGAPDTLVFAGLNNPKTINNVLSRWVAAAGINKRITFHCARHTFATLMLDIGTDLYTVSKLLGHRNIATTQIYAKVIDKNKQAAVAAIPNIIGSAEE